MFGIDVVSIGRVRRLLERSPSAEARIYSAAESALAAGLAPGARERFLAGRFAAKEATLKALGLGLDAGIPLPEIEILRAESGAPVLRLLGAALRAADDRALAERHVSITHEGDMAVAIVMLA